jgi:hypothetical protein
MNEEDSAFEINELKRNLSFFPPGFCGLFGRSGALFWRHSGGPDLAADLTPTAP